MVWTKAFDSVNHEILLAKMGFYGIRGIFHKLLTSYLNNRYQRVVVKDKQATQYFSDWEYRKNQFLGRYFSYYI
jgi:hypothetical protein